MNPIELYYEDKKPAGWACGKCRVFCGADLAWAERCCKCTECDEPRLPHKVFCQKHQDEYNQQRQQKILEEERALFEKAKKIQESKYDGEMLFDGVDYYPDVETFLEDSDGSQKYLWATKKVYPRIDVDDILLSAEERMQCEELEGNCNWIGVEEFKAFVQQWLKKNDHVCCFTPDYFTAILIPEEEEAECPKEN